MEKALERVDAGDERFRSLGFESRKEYMEYVRVKQSMRQRVPIGIAS